MGEYRLSQSAKDDLVGIAQYGDEHFGVVQSNRYRDQLKQRFSVLAIQRSYIQRSPIFDPAITAACAVCIRLTTVWMLKAWR